MNGWCANILSSMAGSRRKGGTESGISASSGEKAFTGGAGSSECMDAPE